MRDLGVNVKTFHKVFYGFEQIHESIEVGTDALERLRFWMSHTHVETKKRYILRVGSRGQ